MNRFDLDEKSKLRKTIEKEFGDVQKPTISDNSYDNNILEDYINIVENIDKNNNLKNYKKFFNYKQIKHNNNKYYE